MADTERVPAKDPAKDTVEVTARKDDEIETAGATEKDPTLDIVRKLIVEAAAVPAPAHRRGGPATPRPAMPTLGRGPGQGQGAAPAPAAAPAAEPAPVQDAMLEAWDDAPEDDWDDTVATGGVRPYGIVDPETGAVVALAGAEEETETDDEALAPPSAARVARTPMLLRLPGAAVRGLATLGARAARALEALAAAGLAAAGRVIARFLRRPDAPRRLATALLVIFVIAWPFQVLWLTLLIPLAALITWASVGNDGCAELVVAWHGRLKARDPDKAERIRLRAAATSRLLSRGLERLPKRWTQGLYLPDFEPEGYVPETLKVDPFEELAAQIHSAKRAGGN